MHAPVTGGAGFISGHLVDSLQASSSVRILDSDPGWQSLNDTIYIEGDIRDENSCSGSCRY